MAINLHLASIERPSPPIVLPEGTVSEGGIKRTFFVNQQVGIETLFKDKNNNAYGSERQKRCRSAEILSHLKKVGLGKGNPSFKVGRSLRDMAKPRLYQKYKNLAENGGRCL